MSELDLEVKLSDADFIPTFSPTFANHNFQNANTIPIVNFNSNEWALSFGSMEVKILISMGKHILHDQTCHLIGHRLIPIFPLIFYISKGIPTTKTLKPRYN
jgi:hypothetical protein